MAGCRDEAKLARDAAVERVEELSDGDEHQCGNDAPRCEHDRRRRAHAKRRPRHLIGREPEDRKSTRLNSSHSQISYAVFCLKKKNVKLGGAGHGSELFFSTRPDELNKAEMIAHNLGYPACATALAACARWMIEMYERIWSPI